MPYPIPTSRVHHSNSIRVTVRLGLWASNSSLYCLTALWLVEKKDNKTGFAFSAAVLLLLNKLCHPPRDERLAGKRATSGQKNKFTSVRAVVSYSSGCPWRPNLIDLLFSRVIIRRQPLDFFPISCWCWAHSCLRITSWQKWSRSLSSLSSARYVLAMRRS